MSETILIWLNNQLEFSYKISNIENEFSNGYYFGQLLHANNLFDKMEELKNTNKKEDSLKNYSLLRKSFDNIDIHLTTSDINELINKKKYKAELYLYKIKQKLALKNCQFNEIMEKMKQESITNKKINFDLILQKKRNKSARPTYNSKKNTNENDINQINNDNTGLIKRHVSTTKNANKINFTNYTQRLKSAKLPNLNKNKKIDRKKQFNYNDNNKDDDQELQEEKRIQSALNNIKIFENIHMSKNKKKMGPNSKNPWDEINYIYNTDSLFKKDKDNEDKKKITIFDIIENKKDNNININNIDNKIAKLKSTLHNHNQFKVDNKKNYINKRTFEQGLFRIGINPNSMLPSIAKIKDKNIPSEIIMKSINDTIKENNILEQKLLNNLNNNSPKNQKIYIPQSPSQKIKNDFNINPSHKRPFSSTTTFNNKTKSNSHRNKINYNIDNKQKIKRPLTAKESKNILSQKENNKINNENCYNKSNNEKKIKKTHKKFLSKIMEDDLKVEENSSDLSDIHNLKNPDEFVEDSFFKKLNEEHKDDRIQKFQMKKSENLVNKKNMKEIVLSIIDMTEVYYDYQQLKEEELIDIKKWHEIEEKFIQNKPIIKRKKKKKVLTEEEIGNFNFDIYSPIDDEYSKNYGEYEICEMKNYIYQIGNKYDRNKNNLFFKKMNLKEENIEINDVMGEEIQILFDKAKAEGNDIRDEDDEEEFKRTGKIRYHPNREEEELLQPYTENISENIFTNLISEIIKFSYNKKTNNNISSSPDKFQKPVSDVIEEPKENSLDNNEEEQLNNNEDIEENNEIKEEKIENKENENDAINNNELNNNGENEDTILLKEILNSIPIKISFVGILNNEIKMTIKNSISKYPKMKIYNPIEFLNDLKQKKKKIDEPIEEQYLKKYQIDQLKKEKNNLHEEIKEYIELIENKDNLSDDEICIKILQKKIKEDFEKKNIENIKQEIINKRETVNNINNELNKLREEQQKKQKTNLRELQVYQQQLDKIDLDTLIGFVIINFPNTYEQSKLIEKKMTNFIQPCEHNKSYFDDINDKLLLLCDKEQKDHIFIKFNSFLEKIVYFYCDNSKLFPDNINNEQTTTLNTGTVGAQNEHIYEFTKNEVEEYKNNFKKVEDFYQNFNLQIDKYDYYEGIIEGNTNQNNYNNNNINMNNNFMIRDRIIIEKLKNALSIYEEKIIPKINNSIINDESVEEGLDVTQIKEKESSRKVSGDGDSSLKPPISNSSKKQIKQQQMKDSNNSSSIKNNDNAKLTPNNNDKIPSQKQLIPNNYKQRFLSIAQISENEKINFYQIWYNFNKQYNYYICRLFYRERNINRKKPEDELEDLQKKFINFLANPKEQKIIIDQFIEKYRNFKDNYCKSKKINNSSNITVIQNFQKDLIELNETLWDIAKIRKNQAFEEIAKLEKENHIERELNIIYFQMERLIILETQKLIIIINIFIRYFTLTLNPKILSTNKQITQFTLDILLSNEILKNVNEEKFAIQKDKTIIYPRANRLYKNCFRVLIKIYIFLENYFAFMATKDKKNLNYSMYKSMKLKKNKLKSASSHTIANNTPINNKLDLQNQIKTLIKIYINKYKYNMYNLYLNSLENLSRIYCPFKQVIKLMDNWIISSMELQNKKIKETLKILDLTNNYKRNLNNDKNVNEQIEKNIVDSIIKDDNNIFNFEYFGINNNDFILFDINNFLGISTAPIRKKDIDNNYLKLYELFKEFDILIKLRNNEIQKGIITKNKFEEIFFKYFLFENIDKFPKAFHNIDYHNISKFLSHFIKFSYEFRNETEAGEDMGLQQELIYTNDIITILVLSCIPFNIYKEIKNGFDNYINKDKFMEINFEFENEIKKRYDKNKNNEFKLYLFNIHKNNNDVPEINIKQFINLLLLKTIKNAPTKEIKKYLDLFEK